MPLAGFKPATTNIPAGPGNSFDVRGLSLLDVATLINTHMPDMDAVFDLVSGVEVKNVEELQPLIMAVVSQAPGLAANVIALAAGEGDASDAELLPAPVQVKALIEIGNLTFAEVGGVGKAWEMVADLLKTLKTKPQLTGNVKAAVKRAAKARSSAGITASAAT